MKVNGHGDSAIYILQATAIVKKGEELVAAKDGVFWDEGECGREKGSTPD